MLTVNTVQGYPDEWGDNSDQPFTFLSALEVLPALFLVHLELAMRYTSAPQHRLE